jgi:hypothetical protein
VCEFLPTTARSDTRVFQADERVCLRAGLGSRRVYEGVYVRRDGNRIIVRGRNRNGQLSGEREWNWGLVGKMTMVENPSDETVVTSAPPENPPESEPSNKPGGRHKRTRKPKRKVRKTRRATR